MLFLLRRLNCKQLASRRLIWEQLLSNLASLRIMTFRHKNNEISERNSTIFFKVQPGVLHGCLFSSQMENWKNSTIKSVYRQMYLHLLMTLRVGDSQSHVTLLHICGQHSYALLRNSF